MLRGVLLDLSGVLYEGDAPVPGAREALDRLRGAGIPHRFVTNTTRRPRRRLVQDLAAMGFEIDAAALFTPAAAARRRLEAERLAPHLLIHPALAEEFEGLADGAGGEAVVLGDAGEGFDYAALNAAFRKLAGGAAFLAMAKNRSFKDADGGLSLDAGAFVAALEYASRREAVVLGKPAPAFFAAALADMGVAAGEAAMIGDDAESDASGALAAGLKAGVLVRTGKYRDGDETRVDPAPTAVVADIGEAVSWILARA